MNFLDKIQTILAVITIVVFVIITLVMRSKKKQIIFSPDKEPPDIFQFDRFSVREEKFDFTLNYEIYVVEENEKELIGYFEEKTNLFLGIFNFFFIILRVSLDFQWNLRTYPEG